MAFPIVQATNTSINSAGGTSTVSLPTGILANDLLIVLVVVDGNPTITWPSGWTQFFILSPVNETKIAAAYRKADGSEGGSITVTISGATKSCHHSYRISGAEAPAVQPPQASPGVEGSIDPDNLIPAGGAKDYLWIAIAGLNQGTTDRHFSGAPTSYTNLLANTIDGVDGVAAGSARRNLNASSENPGVFTLDTGIGGSRDGAATFAIHPSVTVGKLATVLIIS